MELYTYRFPASGSLETKEDISEFISSLEIELNYGMDAMGAYSMFPENYPLEHVSLETDGENGVSAVTLYTYHEMFPGRDRDMKQCIEGSVENASANLYDEQPVFITGGMEDLGKTGEMDDKLYHITERKNLKDITETGLVPSMGANSYYKNYEDKVFLTDEQNAAAWISILGQLDDPVILEVDTQGLDISTGRVFYDRGYMHGKFTEFETRDPVPASSVRELRGDGLKELGTAVYNRLCGFLENAGNIEDLEEIYTGMKRLADMGLADGVQVNDSVEACAMSLHESGKLSAEELDRVTGLILGKDLTDGIGLIQDNSETYTV